MGGCGCSLTEDNGIVGETLGTHPPATKAEAALCQALAPGKTHAHLLVPLLCPIA